MARFCIEPLESRIAPAFAGVVNVGTLAGTKDGFRIEGGDRDQALGTSVSDAGDINGDGFGDVIVGAPWEPGSLAPGYVYVIFGKGGTFAPNFAFEEGGSTGFIINGDSRRLGTSVSAAGDVNGDGFDDLIVGRSSDYDTPGSAYVIFGKASGFDQYFSVSTLKGSNGFKMSGLASTDRAALVSGAGDVNGDGFADVIIGVPGADAGAADSGAAYVVFGKATGFAAEVNLANLDGANGFKLSGVGVNDKAGSSVSAGDINGDGLSDLIIGAPNSGQDLAASGATYVVYGKPSGFGANLDLASLDGSNGFRINGAAANGRAGSFGSSVSGAGDINGDGFNDLVIGASGADAAYVVFGKEGTGLPANSDVSSLDGGNGFKLSPVSGTSVSGAGDVNGDGFADVIVGSTVVFGKTAFDANPSVSALDGTNGFNLTGFPVSPNRSRPLSVSGAGDVNGDGFDDLVIGHPSGTPSGSAPYGGIAYVVFGDGPKLNISDAAVNEGAVGTTLMQFTVSLSEAFKIPVAVKVSTVSGTALVDSDFTATLPTTLTFAPGELSKTFTVSVLGDTTRENDETFSVILSHATGSRIGDRIGVGTIRNDDPLPLVSISDSSVLEGNSGTSSLVFTVSLSAASGLPVRVDYNSFEGTAVAGSDYPAFPSGSVFFAPGETSRTITVNVLGDVEPENDETFSVYLSPFTGALIGDGLGIGTIRNDDGLLPTLPILTIANSSVLEGNIGTSSLVFTVSLSAAAMVPVTVSYTTADGTAQRGSDFTAAAGGQLNFAPGETAKTIIIDVLGDTTVEPSETLSVTLSNAVNAGLANASAIGTIIDDEGEQANVKLIGKHKATFTDQDGDLVTIAVSKGVLKLEDFTFIPERLGSQLALIDFSGEAEFAGANLTITAKGGPGLLPGIRSVDVGYIDARGVDLGQVVIHGDLGRIGAGNDADPRPGVLSLSVDSLGVRGLTTQLSGGSLQSQITGSLRGFKVVDMWDAELAVSGDLGTVIASRVRGGVIHSDGKIGAITIGLDLIEHAGAAAVIDARGDIAAIKIGGDVVGGIIRTDGKIGAIKISGDVGSGLVNDSTISALGNLLPKTSAAALTIASLTVGGSVHDTQILAGYDRAGVVTNSDVRIGAVTVGGDWIASDLVAGVSAGPDGMFGTSDDAAISRTTPLVSKIASILIKGTATGTAGGSDRFGFVAEEIGAFKAGIVKLIFTPGAGNDLSGASIGSTGDLFAHEVA